MSMTQPEFTRLAVSVIANAGRNTKAAGIKSQSADAIVLDEVHLLVHKWVIRTQRRSSRK